MGFSLSERANVTAHNRQTFRLKGPIASVIEMYPMNQYGGQFLVDLS